MKRLFQSAALVCLLFTGSCLSEADFVSEGDTITITFTIEGLENTAVVKATVAPEEGEETVNRLFLYFFEYSDDKTGMFVDYLELTGPLTMNSQYTLDLSATGINPTDAYNIIAVANIGDNKYINANVGVWSQQWRGYNEAYFRSTSIATLSGLTNGFLSNDLLMNGFTTKGASSGSIDMQLTRNVARFDVINNISATHYLKSASVWNVYSSSSITGDAVMDFSKTSGLRERRFYGVDNVIDGSGLYPSSMNGRLYSFENQCSSPAADDQYTTCLVIGMENNGITTYYRVNVNPESSAQSLKRNNVYRLTITGVIESGYATEEEAYAGTDMRLLFAVNNWDVDDNGLTISDSHSILALPTRQVNIGSVGGEFTYTITTFSTLTTNEMLTIKNQVYDPQTSWLTATLTGNNLIFRATPMEAGEEDRTGIITLSYAGLEASMTILQSSSVDMYLTVTLDDTWSGLLSSLAAFASENIFVQSSGPWTATLYGDDGFSLNSYSQESPVTELHSSAVANNRFRVYTNSQNPGPDPRNAFILVSLDEDPMNYVFVIPIQQMVVGAISVSPAINSSGVIFNGVGEITSHISNAFTFTTQNEGIIERYTLDGADSDKFTITPGSVTPSDAVTLTLEAVGQNYSGTAYQATLTIIESTGGQLVIPLRQNSLTIDFSSLPTTNILPVGGQTDLIYVSTGYAASEWTFEINTRSATQGKTLYNHEAYLVDDNGAILDGVQQQSVNTPFRVIVPKIYYPNRDIAVTATVTIRIAGGQLSRTFDVNQSGLVSNGMYIWNVLYDVWGSIGNYYIQALSAELSSYWTSKQDNGNIQSNTTYVHFAPNSNASQSALYDWSVIENFRYGKDGITVVTAEYNSAQHTASLNSFIGRLGYEAVGSGTVGTGISAVTAPVDPNLAYSRIGQFLTSYGRNSFTLQQNMVFNWDNNRSEILNSLPDGAVPVIRSPDSDRILLAIDPVNKLIIMGEAQVFEIGTWWISHEDLPALRTNFVEYISLASQYGSHFTDLLREDANAPRDKDGQVLAAPWDNIWGANRWNP